MKKKQSLKLEKDVKEPLLPAESEGYREIKVIETDENGAVVVTPAANEELNDEVNEIEKNEKVMVEQTDHMQAILEKF